MSEKNVADQCADDTQQFIINIPCPLAARAEKYAQSSGNTITGVVIEALDLLLKTEQKRF
jgi:hypothetical protein